MIHHKLKCIFIHINRNGGKSIENAIWNVDPVHGSADHTTIQQWQLIIDKKTFKNYFKFTFSRNPWDRMVSLFEHYRQYPEFTADRTYPKHGSPKMLDSFEKFVKLSDPKNSKSPVPTQLSYIKGLNGKPDMDFIGRFENYEEDWFKVCRKLNINKPLPHLNKTKHKKYQLYYNSDLTQIVWEKYKEDVQYFRYEF